MDILLILILFFVAWLFGHALDKVFTYCEKLIKGDKEDEEIFTTKEVPVVANKTSQKARLYLIPTVVDKSASQS